MKKNLLMRLSKTLRIRKVVKVHYEITNEDLIFKNLDPSKNQTIYFEVIQPERWVSSFSFTIGDTTYHKEHIEDRCKFTIPKGIDEIHLIIYGVGKFDVLFEPSKLKVYHGEPYMIKLPDNFIFDTSKITDMTNMFNKASWTDHIFVPDETVECFRKGE